jgi:hypothetical protein
MDLVIVQAPRLGVELPHQWPMSSGPERELFGIKRFGALALRWEYRAPAEKSK